MIQRYFTAYIWLGIVSITIAIFINLFLNMNNSFVQFIFDETDFLTTTTLFLIPYLIGVLWLWYVKPVWDVEKVLFTRRIWWIVYLLLLLFWVCRGMLLYFPVETYGGGWTVYPPLKALKDEAHPIDTVVNRVICEGLSMLMLLLVMFLQLINLLVILYIRWKTDGFGKTRRLTQLLTIIALPGWVAVGGMLAWSVLLLVDVMMGANFLFTDVYIAGVPPTTSINPAGFRGRTYIAEYIGYSTLLTLICFILYSHVPRSRVGLMYLFIAITGVGMSYFSSVMNLNILIGNYYMVAHPPMYGWKYMIILGGLAVLYQLIFSNEQHMKPLLSYIHLIIFVLGFIWIINNEIPVSTNESFWKFRKKELSVIYILLLVGQFCFMINYGIALLNNKKAPA